jgi:hypothetical protein
MQMRDIIQIVAEMATKPPETVKAKTFYHGTSKVAAAKSILKNGLRPPELNGKKHMLTPVNGMVYLTPELGYALIYAAGGSFLGNDSFKVPYRGANKEKFSYLFTEPERYGFIFEVPGSALEMVQPDEDEIGELYGWCLQKEPGPSKFHGARDRAIWAAFQADANQRWNFKALLDSCATDRQKREVRDGYTAYYAHVGKKAAKRMSDSMKAWLVEIGLHVAHQGALIPTACWKFDKTKVGWMDKDGGNFHEFAKRIR